MLSQNRAVRDRRSRALRYCARGAHADGAVDNRDLGFEEIDVSGGLAHEVLDLVRNANMQNVNRTDRPRRRLNVYSDCVQFRGQQLKEWPANLSEANDHDFSLFLHFLFSLSFPLATSQRIEIWAS